MTIFHRIAAFALLAYVPAAAASAAESGIETHGLFEYAFDVDLEYGNPFDSASIQVDARIIPPSGGDITVPCFFDGDEGWKLRHTPVEPGTHMFEIEAAAGGDTVTAASGEFEAVPSNSRGFVRTANNNPRFFAFGNGEPYFPLGQNIGWVNPPAEHMWQRYLEECGAAGINWIRIWMCSWGMTELVWTPQGGRYHGIERYDLRNARMIDSIFREAEKQGVYIVWVINHHGQYSAETNPIWDENPYNAENGGYLGHPSEFFTNDTAKRHYRDRLRYLVARWGHNTHLMAWEFWNEVDLTSGYDRETVGQWHAEMAEYLRGIDPHDHLRSTSASGNFGGNFITDGIDFLQSHSYIPNLIGKINAQAGFAAERYPDVPHFHGEMSYDWRGPVREDREGVSLHNQLWSSAHSRDGGTAMTWWWDSWVRPFNLYPRFKSLSGYLDGVDWLSGSMAPLTVSVEPRPENRTTLTFFPTQGWGSTERREFTVRPDGTIEGGNELTSFVHGQAHRDMAPNPEFRISVDEPTEFGFEIGRVARAGAACLVRVNSETVFQTRFPAAEGDTSPGGEGRISFTLQPGDNRVRIINSGPDWFEVSRYWVGRFADRISVHARGNGGTALVWIHDHPHQLASIGEYPELPDTESTRMTLPALERGEYRVERWDTWAGEAVESADHRVENDGLTLSVPSFRRDFAYKIVRLPSAVE